MPDHDSPPLPAAHLLLAAPAALSARLLCREFAAQAARAVRDINAEGVRGVEARHGLRVALRRLRVTLQAYRTPLDTINPEKLARRAGALARRVGNARNLDVQRLLLDSVQSGRTAPQRAALERVSQATLFAAGEALDTDKLRQRWDRFATRLHASLGVWHEEHHLDAQPRTVPFSRAAADALDRASRQLVRKCAAIKGPDDTDAMHASRLAFKRVRYLIGPIAGDDAEAVAILQSLRAAQELLGGINDASELRARVSAVRPVAGDVAVRQARVTIAALDASDRDLTQRITRNFDALLSWRADASLTGHFSALQSLAATWRRGTVPPMEYERKWLLSALPPRVRGLTPSLLHQGYLAGDTLVERIRSVTDGGSTSWFRTVKLGRGIARIEVEEQTTATLGQALFALTHGKRVEKRRYAVTDGPLVWEVDDFTDRELVLVEVEFPDMNTDVTFPAWLAPWIVREVTDESAFTNWKLAR